MDDDLINEAESVLKELGDISQESVFDPVMDDPPRKEDALLYPELYNYVFRSLEPDNPINELVDVYEDISGYEFYKAFLSKYSYEDKIYIANNDVPNPRIHMEEVKEGPPPNGGMLFNPFAKDENKEEEENKEKQKQIKNENEKEKQIQEEEEDDDDEKFLSKYSYEDKNYIANNDVTNPQIHMEEIRENPQSNDEILLNPFIKDENKLIEEEEEKVEQQQQNESEEEDKDDIHNENNEIPINSSVKKDENIEEEE